jgi:serine/threonine protein kinase
LPDSAGAPTSAPRFLEHFWYTFVVFHGYEKRDGIESEGISWRYEMATGQQPFCGTTTAVIYEAILNRVPAPAIGLNPNLPPKLEEIINKGLEKDRELRYQHAADIRTDLKRLQRDTSSGRPAPAQIPHARGCASCMTRLCYRVGCKGSALKVACSRPLILAPRGPYVPRAPPIWSWVGSGTFA